MDFQSLSRKELQVLCKKNKIPANITNVAMADALAALPNVEGIDEIGNAQSVLLSPQTCKGTSKRPIKQADTTTENKPKSSVTVTRTRRGAQKILNQEVENENNDNPPRSILKTPATRTTRRRPAGATSVCKNIEGDKAEEKNGKDEEKNVATLGHTTRRSTRFLSEKKGKSITEAFEISDENDKGTSENDEDNTEEISSAQTEKFVTNSDNAILGGFSIDDDRARPHNDVNQVLNFVVDPNLDEADVSKLNDSEIVVHVAEDITKTNVNEVLVVDDVSNVNANEVLISVDDASKLFADQCLIPTKDQVSVEAGSNADEVCNNPVDKATEDGTDQVLIHSSNIAFDNENQLEDENSGVISEKTESLHCGNQEFKEPLSTVDIQMDDIMSDADPVGEPDSSLQVQVEIEILCNQNPSESSEIPTMVIPFSSSSTSTPSQVPTTPKLAASDYKPVTNQIKTTPISSNKKATPIPKMVLKVFEEDSEIMIAAEEKYEQISSISMEVVEDKENTNKGEDTVQKSLKKKSLRQLRKLFKEKLVIVDDGKENMQIEKMRPVLYTLTDNCAVGNEEN